MFSPGKHTPLAFSATATQGLPLPPQPLTALVGLPPRPSAGARTQTMLRGSGWFVADGSFAVPGGAWDVRVRRQEYDGVTTWTSLREALGEHSELKGARAVLLDLQDAPRISGLESSQAFAAFLAQREAQGFPVAVLIAADLIQQARVLRLLSHHAPQTARCVRTTATAMRWLKLAPRLAPTTPAS